ncbi:DUF6477 family protein [uncultured Roseovarius sp.]|uniref:DUF6477 family protein n=1 Tax=uncultured Roseovarius sp. TaxID=293344 RepID=UPI00261D68AD|nr:DUF6477 family protein [uncultured Roseovarius sp.]
MHDILGTLRALHRPPLLIRAARIGLDDYRRDIHLRRHIGDGTLPRSAVALMSLIETEAMLERDRLEQASTYSPAQHVDVLIVMMGEARQLTIAPALSRD